MQKTLLEIYALLVCFVTLIYFSIQFGIVSYNIVGLLDPEITIDSWQYERHQSNDSFWNNRPTQYPSEFSFPHEEKIEPPVRPSEDQLTKNRAQSYEKTLRIEKRNNKQDILRSFIALFISLVLFFLHWKLAKKSRANN